ncbi:MAG: DUF1329 domain-containing protein [Pseudomonadota bacterium]
MIAGGSLAFASSVMAAATTEEVAKLKTTLTPVGAERAGNKEGTIPAWSGGYTTPIPGFKNGGRRGDPFVADKPLLTISAKNMAEHAEQLSDGVKAMMKKYPGYRIDVYPTRRTAAAPQWVYDNTTKNGLRAKVNERYQLEGGYAGIPFPIPKSGVEVMWNHLMRWRGESYQMDIHGLIGTADGRNVMTVDALGDFAVPYYNNEVSLEKWSGEYWTIRQVNSGPPIRAGEAITGRLNVDPEKDQSWVYLAGQRRVRKLPNACCDTPTPATAGVMSFDELEVFAGRTDRFDWKLIGKKEMYIPYNTNKTLQPSKDGDVMIAHFLNPDHVRWELHRVWVVEASLRKDQRHVAPKSRYYIDEDTWNAVLGDRWDANGQLWKTVYGLPVVMPDLPATASISFGFYDLISGTQYNGAMFNEKASQYKIMPRYGAATFTPDAMTGQGLR